ncbi:MAG: VOC family protein [Azoarcus sp.]|nr:VOC family protein [Azoarcus sp.]
MIKRMDHFTIVTDQLDNTHSFYTELLGLEEGPRPPFPVPGYWLYAGKQAVLHVVGVDQMPEPRRGALDHMAFHAEGFSETLDHLDKAGIPYRIIRAPGDIRTWQVFMFDPNGVEVELDFEAAERAPADWKVRGRVTASGADTS